MPKFQISYSCSIDETIEIEADSEEEARDTFERIPFFELVIRDDFEIVSVVGDDE